LDVCDITIASWFHETNNGMDGQNERKQWLSTNYFTNLCSSRRYLGRWLLTLPKHLKNVWLVSVVCVHQCRLEWFLDRLLEVH
jgi:hypothetical protein